MDTILGQQHAIETLQRALAGERLHHAWIFHGPIGVGKCTTALRFARVLLCPNATTDLAGQTQACGSCKSCALIDSPHGAHPDLHVITKELARYSDSDEVRKRKLASIPLGVIDQFVHEPAATSAVMNHNKVFIIDEAELLNYSNNPAANTMLKLLEEPPDGTAIILITSKVHRLLATMRSRAQAVAFTPIDDDDVRTWLTDQDIDIDRIPALIHFARGSLGLARLAVDFDLDQWVTTLEPMIDAMASGRYPVGLGPTMHEMVDGFAAAWVGREKDASKLAANQTGVHHLIGVLGEICRARLATCAESIRGADPNAVDAAVAPWLAGIDLMRSAERDLAANVNLALLLDNLAIQWAAACRPAKPIGAAG